VSVWIYPIVSSRAFIHHNQPDAIERLGCESPLCHLPSAIVDVLIYRSTNPFCGIILLFCEVKSSATIAVATIEIHEPWLGIK
jgi:hypothetical protein